MADEKAAQPEKAEPGKSATAGANAQQQASPAAAAPAPAPDAAAPATGAPAAPATEGEGAAAPKGLAKVRAVFSSISDRLKKKSKDGAPEGASRGRRALSGTGDVFVEVIQALISGSLFARFMVLLLIVSTTGVLLIGVHGWQRYREYSEERRRSGKVEGIERIGQFVGKQAEEARRRHSTLVLGEFVVELKRKPGERRIRGTMGMAEIGLVVECDHRNTCVFLGERNTQVRDQLTNVFVATDRDEILSQEGKRRLRRALIDRINAWLPKGRVVNLYFNKLVVD